MGKIKAHAQDFLEEGGYDLGYDMSNLPELADFKYVLKEQLDPQDYRTKRDALKQDVEEFKAEVKELINAKLAQAAKKKKEG